MTDKDEQLEHFRDAVDRKAEAAREAARAQPHPAGSPEDESGEGSRFQRSLEEHGRPPDVGSPRAKSTGHGKKTADKWNQ